MSLGEKIRLLRNEKKVSIRKLAELTGLSKSTLSDIENNISKKPSIDTVGKIAKALQISFKDLIDDVETTPDMEFQHIAETKDHENTAEENKTDNGMTSSNFLRTVARAKDRPKETQDRIAEFIELILEQEDNKR